MEVNVLLSRVGEVLKASYLESITTKAFKATHMKKNIHFIIMLCTIMNVINYAVETTNTCGYYISTVGHVIFSTIALKIELVFLWIAMKASNFAWRFANKLYTSLCLNFVHSIMAL